MNANLILALERDFETLTHISRQASSLANDGTPMPDGQGTVASRFKTVVLAFVPNFGDMARAAAGDPAPAPATIAPSAKTDVAADSGAAPFVGAPGSIQCTMKIASDGVLKVGDFHIYDDRSHILIWLPGDQSATLLPLQPANAQGWILAGEHDDSPTLTPSIFRDPPHGWHGWLTDGVLSTVPSAPVPRPPADPAEIKPATIRDMIQPEPVKPGKKFWMAGMGPPPLD